MSVVTRLPVDHSRPAGTVSGPPILLIHGFASNAAQDWPIERWAQPLARAGRETLVVHLPGHGGGPTVDSADDVTIERLLAALGGTVTGVLDGRAADGVDVVGYSLGARLAWDLVGTGAVPARRLVLGGLSPMEPFAAVDIAAARAYCRGGAEPADPLTSIIAGLAQQSGRDTESLLCLVEALARAPFDPAATPPAVPTLVLAGDADPITQGLEQVAGLVPDAQFARVAGDHLGVLAGEPFRTAVFDFLGVAR